MHLRTVAKLSSFQIITSTLLLITMYPSRLHSFDELSNITNTIHKNLNGPSYEDQSMDDFSSAPPGGGTCGSCKMREAVRTRSLEAIKEQILLRLGMQTALNTTGRKLPQIPQDVIAQYPNLALPGMMSDQPQPSFRPGPHVQEEEDIMHIKTENIMVFSKPYPKLRHSWRGQGIQYFQFSDRVTKHRVKTATLYVWVRGSGEERPSTKDIQIKVYKVLKDSSRIESPVLQQKAQSTVRQSVSDGRWIKIDATVMISEWFKNSKENLGFVVNATFLDGQRVVVTDNTVEGGKHMPFVDLEIQETRKRRTKRTLGMNCNEDEHRNLCCRYPLTVDFEEFGWDFIIAPKRYEANYCSGECPYMTLQKHAHTHLSRIANPASGGPCCAPRKFSAISMLYFDQEYNIIYGSLPGMVVDRCGCS